MIRKVGIAVLLALALAGQALAKDALPQIKIAVGGANCVCYLPTVLAQQLGAYEQAGVAVELINFKGGSTALTAVLGGSADVVSGYYDHCVNLAAKNKAMQAFVTYDRVPGFVLVVVPKQTAAIKSVKDLVGMKVGVTAPGSTTDFFVKYLLAKSGIDATQVAVIGIGADATAVAAVEQGSVDAAVVLDPVTTLLQGRHKDMRILSDTRSVADTVAVFGGEYPGGSLYAPTDWVEKHPVETQALTDAIVFTLKWIQSHSAEEIMAKMPEELIGPDRELYLAALKNTIPIYSKTGKMDPKGAAAVLAVFSQSVPEIANAHIDLSKTYTNAFAEKADAKLGVSQ
jgi:NitT/TauT family transport system substrate-binding protein